MKTSRIRTTSAAAASLAAVLAVGACSGGSSSNGDTTVSGNVADAVENDFGGQAVEDPQAKAGGTFTWAMAAPIPHLDPRKAIGASIVGPIAAIYEPLMTLDAEGAAQPLLAKSMESDDLKTWTMKLPTGLKFSDGTPFNAQAVVDNTKAIASETSESQQAYQARQISEVKADGEDTVVFTLKSEWAQFPTIFADISSLALVPSPTAVKKEGEKFGLNPVGVGPYQVKEFKPGQSVTLTKNPDYRTKGEPLVETLKYVTLPEADARISGMQTGQIDGTAMRTPADVEAAKGAGLRVLTQPSYNYYTIYVNQKDEALGDERVRRAMSMATDRKGINQSVFKGAVGEMKGFLTEDHPNFSEDPAWPAFDEAQAKKLVDEYKKEAGVKEVKIDMVLPGIPEMSRIAAVLQQQWAKAGITLNYKTGNPSEMVSQAVSGTYDLQMRDSGIQPETYNRMMTNFSGDSPASVVGKDSKVFDDLMTKSFSSPDKRAENIDEIQVELNQWLPQIPLVESLAAVAVGDNVAAFPGTYPTTSAESFRVNKVAVKK
jgi:peptide/nickel transport system substrate-binding protein